MPTADDSPREDSPISEDSAISEDSPISEETPPEDTLAEEPDTADGDAGRLIAGRYRLERQLGGGSMGAVWAAQDELLRRPVAVKQVLLPSGMPEAEAAELRERTLREARAIALVTHPNVVTLYDVAREGGEPFVVMELVPSQSLATILDEHGPLDDRQLAAVADAVAAALQAAHRAGVIHRDVKPGNVLLSEDGRIKLSDFGISRNIAEPTLTHTGIMLGTPSFIAPEVASGDQVTAAADLWEFGATLFAAAEGRPPYDADDNPLATITEVVHGPIPETGRNGPLGEVVAGLMVKDPARRLPLSEVRRKILPLLPAAHERPFAMLLEPEAPTMRVHKPAPTAEEARGPVPPSPPVPKQPERSAPLAAEPGPLPFTPREPTPARSRSGWARAGLGAAAVLVFAAATVGSFAATRMFAGQSVFPPLPAPPAARLPALVPVNSDASPGTGDGGGQFALSVPPGWTMFRGQRQGAPIASSQVHFIAPDGTGELTVERFGGFYTDGYRIDSYLSALRGSAAGGQGVFRTLVNTPLPGRDPASGEPDRQVVYETVENAITHNTSDVARRTTFVRVMPRNGDLWVLAVTCPTGRQPQCQQLLDTVQPTFTPRA